MPAPLSGPGIGLPIPQFLYPRALYNAPYDLGTPEMTLNAGDELPIPAGTWYVSPGIYLIVEWYDPVSGTWRIVARGAQLGGPLYIKSDGFNYRVANRLGCPVGAVVTQYGGGWTQSSTSIAVTGGGGSTWSPIVGGQLTASVTSAGAGYGVNPMVIIPPPPGPGSNANGVGGIPANGYPFIQNGTLHTSGFTFTNPGAGYQVAPAAVPVLPNPTDPNINTGITLGTITFSLTGSASVTGALCTNPGQPISNPANITLTVSGAGSNATVTPVMLQTVTAASVVGGSTLSGASVAGLVTTVGGAWPAGTVTNSPEFLGLRAIPRPAHISLTVGAAGTIAAQTGTIIDGGLFFAAPTAQLVGLTNLAAGVPGSVIGSSTLTLTMGSRPDVVWIQPAP